MLQKYSTLHKEIIHTISKTGSLPQNDVWVTILQTRHPTFKKYTEELRCKLLLSINILHPSVFAYFYCIAANKGTRGKNLLAK